MRYLQLGNGGGLNPLATNSSFLIEIKKDEYLLFDCGFNIMAKLLEVEKDSSNGFHISQIKYVYVSHTHDDHVGNVETLMFWNFFKNDVSMTFLYANSEVRSYYDPKIFPRLYTGGQLDSDSRIYSRVINIDTPLGEIENIKISSLQNTFHGDCKSNGIVIINTRTNTGISISGDTKASVYLEEEILFKLKNCSSSVIYHDYSNWDCPSKNVHTCKTDFEDEYSEEFRNQIIKYHDNGYFKKDWQEW